MTHIRTRPPTRRGGKKCRLAKLKFLYLENQLLRIAPTEYPPEFIQWRQKIEDFAKLLANFTPPFKKCDDDSGTDCNIAENQTLAVVKGLMRKAKIEKRQGNFKQFLTSIATLLTEKADLHMQIDDSEATIRLNSLKQNRPSVIAWAAQNDNVPATSYLLLPKLEPSSEISSDESTEMTKDYLDRIGEPS